MVLKNFIKSGDTELLSVINDDLNKDYRHLLSNKNYKICELLSSLKKIPDLAIKNSLIEFVDKFGIFLAGMNLEGMEEFF